MNLLKRMYEEHSIPYSIIMAGLNSLAIVFYLESQPHNIAMGSVLFLTIVAGTISIIAGFAAILDEMIKGNGKTVSTLLHFGTILDIGAVIITLASLLVAT